MQCQWQASQWLLWRHIVRLSWKVRMWWWNQPKAFLNEEKGTVNCILKCCIPSLLLSLVTAGDSKDKYQVVCRNSKALIWPKKDLSLCVCVGVSVCAHACGCVVKTIHLPDFHPWVSHVCEIRYDRYRTVIRLRTRYKEHVHKQTISLEIYLVYCTENISWKSKGCQALKGQRISGLPHLRTSPPSLK